MSEIPWPVAERLASSIAGHHPLEHSYHMAQLEVDARAAVLRAGALVSEETSLETPGEPAVEVVDRQRWVAQNLRFFSRLMEPAEAKIRAKLEQSGSVGKVVSGGARGLVVVESGALLGVMARRVLGQYELVLPSDDSSGDVVFLVGPNILALERAHQFVPSEFRFWLALHESAHRAQFVGVPWMQEYFFGLITDLVAAAEPEPQQWKRVATQLKGLKDLSADGIAAALGDAGLLGLFASPGQREVIDRVQALMSLLEGHGHVIMDRIGGRSLLTTSRMSTVLKTRRTDPRMAAFFRITGLEMKIKQYEMGERFVLGVERIAGWPALDAAWSHPDALPTLAEIEDPSSWLARVA